MRQRETVSYQHVLEATKKWALEEGRFTIDDARWRVAETLGRERTQYERSYDGQVSRALNALADEGVLRKVSKGTKGPGSRVWSTTTAWYFTPEHYESAEQSAAEAAAATKALGERWTNVHSVLRSFGLESSLVYPKGAWGFEDREAPPIGVTLPGLTGWEQLATLLSAEVGLR